MPGVVTAPQLDPPRYGLVVSARTPTDPAGVRWEDGFDWAPESCGGDGGITDVCETPIRDRDAPRPGRERFIPYLVWEPDQCSTMGNGEGDINAAEREARARRRLLAWQSFHIEAELWTGADGDVGNQRFESANADQMGTAGAPIALRDALAGLEEGLAHCVPRGMIHATIPTMVQWHGLGLIRREGDLILTLLNTIVVAGAGYPGSSPDGTAAAADGSSAWAYATGIVDLRLSPIDIPGSGSERMHPGMNDVTTYAQRVAAATFDPCCLFAINVDLTTRD